MTDYRVVVAFNDTGEITDDWSWFYSEVRAACAGSGVRVVHHPHETELDIGPFREHRLGYVLAEAERAPRYQPYDQPQVVLRAIAEYFGVEL